MRNVVFIVRLLPPLPIFISCAVFGVSIVVFMLVVSVLMFASAFGTAMVGAVLPVSVWAMRIVYATRDQVIGLLLLHYLD
jgi:hypothetical protein